MELYQELQNKSMQLEMALKTYRTNGIALASSEREYKVKLREEILKLRDEGVAVGIIDKVCYGIPSIADLRFKRDCAEAVYKANQEAINVKKLEIKIIQEQINKEWGSND